ncbi:MAG TPA: hypothetical protein VGJ07_12780 [Rugosimonospora sp.]
MTVAGSGRCGGAQEYAALVRSLGIDGDEALDIVRAALLVRPDVPPTGSG